MIKFYPTWTMAPGVLTNTLMEGGVVSIPLPMIDSGLETVPTAPTVTVTVPHGTSISAVRAHSVVIPSGLYTLDNGVLTIVIGDTTGLPPNIIIEVDRTPAITYTVLSGSLPPGLAIENGTITGTISNIPAKTVQTYSFTIRGSNGARLSDQVFSIEVMPVATPYTWVRATLPPFSTDQDLDLDFYDFGTFSRYDYVLRSLTANNPDGTDPEIVMIEITSVIPDSYDGLPPGVNIVGNTVKGTVRPDAPIGRYFFQLGFADQSSEIILGLITVQSQPSENALDPNPMVWVTPEGHLGTLPETYPSPFSVVVDYDGLVTYRLAPGSRPLPPGLNLGTNGIIRGKPSHVAQDTEFTFTVRATNDSGTTIDRAFSIKVEHRFTTTSVLDVHFRPNVNIRAPMMARYSELVAEEFLFRPADTSFGLPNNPNIYIVKGLSPTSLADAMQGDGNASPDGTNDYSKGVVVLRLGRHKSAHVRDENGEIIYEVIYREVIDPQAKAGGFSRTSEKPVEEKVLWGQSGATPMYVYPHSMRNIRFDLAKDIGFATDIADKKQLLGLTGVECLPDWMRSPQKVSDPSSALGYLPALVVAYVIPGGSSLLLDTLNRDRILPPNGREIAFDHYYSVSEFSITSFTLFDEDDTFFDDGRTLFDATDSGPILNEDGVGV